MTLTDETRQISYKEASRILLKNGWYLDRQKGSHCMYKHPDGRRFMASVLLGPRYDHFGMKKFVKQLRTALRGEDTFKPRM